MELTELQIRMRLRKLRRLQPSGTSLGLSNQVRELAEEFTAFAAQLDTRPKTPKKKGDRESNTGRDREETGGQDRSDS